MSVFITIDGGTTHTRIYLLENGRLRDQKRRPVGVRNTAMDGNNKRLKRAVKEMLTDMLRENHIEFDDVEAVYASGMLTSNVGLYELPHLAAPAGIKEFAEGVKKIRLEDVAPIQICFIPGLKNAANDERDIHNADVMDIMRGEETEAIAVLEDNPELRNAVLVLPGSHTKFIVIDEKRQMTGCLTSMTGELLSIVTENSIVADSVGKSYLLSEPDWEYLHAGCQLAKNSGSFGRTAFITRILEQTITRDKRCLQSFLLGAVLENDIAAVRNSRLVTAADCVRAIVAGKASLGTPLAYLLERSGLFREVVCYQETQDESPLSVRGAMAIHQYRREHGI